MVPGAVERTDVVGAASRGVRRRTEDRGVVVCHEGGWERSAGEWDGGGGVGRWWRLRWSRAVCDGFGRFGLAMSGLSVLKNARRGVLRMIPRVGRAFV